MALSLPELLEKGWMEARALPGREAAAHNEVLPAFQPCPLSGKPDIEPTPPNDEVLTQFRRRSHFVTHETAAWINDVISYRLRICRCCSSGQ
jgi:hypothetical protein